MPAFRACLPTDCCSTFNQRRSLTIAVLLMAWYPCLSAAAQERVDSPSAEAEQQLVERWMRVYEQIADSLRVGYQEDTQNTVPQNTVPKRSDVLTISNAQLGGRHGRVYLWTVAGRPMAIASFMSSVAKYKPMYRNVNYEFHSLSQQPVQVSKDQQIIWECKEPGIQWTELEFSVTPASTPQRRLIQMRAIARSISAKGPQAAFRLIPQPLYRYSIAEDAEVDDGALFSYSKSSDPCVFLLVEARKDKWFVAFARSNHHELQIERDGEVLLTFKEKTQRGRVQNGPFYLFWFGELRPVSIPEVLTKSAYQ